MYYHDGGWGWVMPTERQNTKEIEGAGESAFK